MDANVAHPSVRVKGTEQTYTPVLCHDERCDSREKGVHMHCPLCPVAEAYQDPIILRAHFRIKHVDKGIDFAGLKVLRCCNHCEIVGTIKGEKRFKGAHWHCYRCRNGFNRKDEAIKHYKTHFRNPHTTFQIQIAQEVNCRRYYDQSPEAHPKAYGGLPVSTVNGGTTVSSVLTQPLLTSATSTETLLKDSTANNGISLGAEEEVGLSQNTQTQTLVLMDPDLKGENVVFEETTSIITEQGRDNVELNLLMQKHLLELHQHNETLQQEKEDMEWKLRAEIKQLKDQVTSLVRSNVKMFEELQLYRNPESSQDSVAKLLKKLESQHRELLLTQLASLRTELLCQEATLPLNGHTEVLQFGMHSENAGSELEGQGQVGSALAGLEIVELQLDSTEEDLREDLEGPESGKTEMLPGLDSPGSESDASPPGTAYSAAEHPEETPGQTPTTQLCMKRTAEVDVAETSESKVQRVS